MVSLAQGASIALLVSFFMELAKAYGYFIRRCFSAAYFFRIFNETKIRHHLSKLTK